jgi:hypothetical protein
LSPFSTPIQARRPVTLEFTLIGVTAEISLVGVAVVQARRQSLLAIEVEEKRQDFDDAAGGGVTGEGRRQRTQQKETQQQPAHDPTITGDRANSTAISCHSQ